MTDEELPRRVLIIGANYWPEESGSAPYTTGLAEDLAARGVAVTVLAAVPHYPQWRVRESYRGRIHVRESHNGVELVHSWLWVPTHQSAAQRALWEGTFLVNTLFARGVQRADVVLASTPSLSGAIAARLFARRFRVPYGLVVQDLVGPGAIQSGISGGAAVSWLARRGEAWAMRRAARIAVVSPGFVPYVRDLGVEGERIEHIPNWSNVPASTADPAEIRSRLGLAIDGTIVMHAGAMGLKQGLDQVVDAARLANEQGAELCFVLVGEGSRRRELEERASGLPNIVFLPQQPKDGYADVLAAADVLVVSERHGMSNMSLPGKLTSYLTAGRPIVAAVPPDGATAAEVRRSGAGLITPAGDPGSLVAVLRALVGDPDRRAELSVTGPEFARRELDRETSLARLRGFVAALDAQPRAG